MTGRPRRRLFRQVYAAVLGAVLSFAALITVVRYFEPRGLGVQPDGYEIAHVFTVHWLMALALLLALTAAVSYPIWQGAVAAAIAWVWRNPR